MENQSDIKVITLGDLWDVFLKRIWIILAAAILTVVTVLVAANVTYVPKYKSTATLYILQQNQTDTGRKEYEDFTLALKVVNDCSHLLKSRSVLEQVIQNLDLDYSYEALYHNVRIDNPTDTRILEVRVEADTPYNAKIIADEICAVGTYKITEAMGFKQVNFYESGAINMQPCNRTPVWKYLLYGAITAVLVYAIFFLIYLFDDNIRTEEDIEQYLKASILGDIPNFEESGKKKYGGRYYRSRYYKSRYYKKSYGEENAQ